MEGIHKSAGGNGNLKEQFQHSVSNVMSYDVNDVAMGVVFCPFRMSLGRALAVPWLVTS